MGINKQDQNLFKHAMDDVTPLSKGKKLTNKPKPNKLKARAPQEDEISSNLHPNDFLEPIDGDAYLSHKHSSLSERLFKQLKRGQMTIEDELDLHGLTIDQSSVQVSEFLSVCRENQTRVARIIHGKGNIVLSSKAKLKTQLNAWLASQDFVLAFCSCLPKHGGTGAIYVLLRKQKGEGLE